MIKLCVFLILQVMWWLKFLGVIDSLGVGFNFVLQDLDLCGVGNFLGEEQLGYIKEVGFEFYQVMLEEMIVKLKFGEIEGMFEDEWVLQLNLGVLVMIFESYIFDLDVWLGLYWWLFGLIIKVELEGFVVELIDRFGLLLCEVNMLLLVICIKVMVKWVNILKLDVGLKGVMVQFYGDCFLNLVGLVEFIYEQCGQVKVSDNKIVVLCDWQMDVDWIKGVFGIVKDLVVKIKEGCVKKG